MKTDAAQARHAEYLRRHDLGDEGEHRQVGVQRDEFIAHLRRFERVMLAHRNAEIESLLFYRVEFAVGRIDRAIDRDHFLAFTNEFFQSLFAESRLADEDDSHVVDLQSGRS